MRSFDLPRIRARFLRAISVPSAILSLGACAEKPPAAREPTAVSVEPPPEASETDQDDQALPEGDRPRDNDRTAVWVEGEHVCVNEAGTDASSGQAFGRCHQRPDPELISRSGVSMGCCGLRLDENMSNRERAAGRRAACCYVVISLPVPGRPLRDAGRTLVAPTSTNESWRPALGIDRSSLSPQARAVLSAAWTRDALLEHASVASFAQFSLDLLALAAPAELLVRASRAALDEIEHAKLCFALASAYAGSAVGPGPLPLPASRVLSPEALAEEIFRDGCVGETRAAVEARRAAQGTRAPAIRRVLERIARDEEEHAELAWLALAWLLEIAPGVRAVIARCVGEIGAELEAALEPQASQPELGEHGRLDPLEQLAIARSTFDQVIVPCASALLGDR